VPCLLSLLHYLVPILKMGSSIKKILLELKKALFKVSQGDRTERIIYQHSFLKVKEDFTGIDVLVFALQEAKVVVKVGPKIPKKDKTDMVRGEKYFPGITKFLGGEWDCQFLIKKGSTKTKTALKKGSGHNVATVVFVCYRPEKFLVGVQTIQTISKEGPKQLINTKEALGICLSPRGPKGSLGSPFKYCFVGGHFPTKVTKGAILLQTLLKTINTVNTKDGVMNGKHLAGVIVIGDINLRSFGSFKTINDDEKVGASKFFQSHIHRTTPTVGQLYTGPDYSAQEKAGDQKAVDFFVEQHKLINPNEENIVQFLGNDLLRGSPFSYKYLFPAEGIDKEVITFDNFNIDKILEAKPTGKEGTAKKAAVEVPTKKALEEAKKKNKLERKKK